jgi:hypothetical protein
MIGWLKKARENAPKPQLADWITISREGAIQRSVGIISLVAAVSAVFLSKWLETLPPIFRAAAIIGGSGGLYGTFLIADRWFTRARHKRLRGSWLYITTNDVSAGDQTESGPRRFAFMRIAPRVAGDIDIHIIGFKCPEAMCAFARGDAPPDAVTGQGTSLASRFDEREGVLHFIYALRFDDGRSPRFGRMALSVLSGRGLSGRWTSEGGGEVRTGRLVARRLEDAPCDVAGWNALVE